MQISLMRDKGPKGRILFLTQIYLMMHFFLTEDCQLIAYV